GVAQVPPGGVDPSLLVVVLLDVVPMGDVGVTHAGSILAPRSSARDRTAEDAGMVEVLAEQRRPSRSRRDDGGARPARRRIDGTYRTNRSAQRGGWRAAAER